jgi:hypothetical protein
MAKIETGEKYYKVSWQTVYTVDSFTSEIDMNQKIFKHYDLAVLFIEGLYKDHRLVETSVLLQEIRDLRLPLIRK